MSIEDLCQGIEILVQQHLDACCEEAVAAVERSLRTSLSHSRRKTKTKKPPKTIKPTKPSTPRGRRRSEAEMKALAEQFHELVLAQPGKMMSDYAPQLGVTPSKLWRPVGRLKRARLIRSVGERRVMRYFPILSGKTRT